MLMKRVTGPKDFIIDGMTPSKCAEKALVMEMSQVWATYLFRSAVIENPTFPMLPFACIVNLIEDAHASKTRKHDDQSVDSL